MNENWFCTQPSSIRNWVIRNRMKNGDIKANWIKYIRLKTFWGNHLEFEWKYR